MTYLWNHSNPWWDLFSFVMVYTKKNIITFSPFENLPKKHPWPHHDVRRWKVRNKFIGSFLGGFKPYGNTRIGLRPSFDWAPKKSCLNTEFKWKTWVFFGQYPKFVPSCTYYISVYIYMTVFWGTYPGLCFFWGGWIKMLLSSPWIYIGMRFTPPSKVKNLEPKNVIILLVTSQHPGWGSFPELRAGQVPSPMGTWWEDKLALLTGLSKGHKKYFPVN